MRFESSGHSAPLPGLFGRTRSGSYFEGNINIHKWKLALAVLAIALFAAWYAFRAREVGHQSPGKRSFPAGEDPSSAQVLESGTFYAVVHPTAGTPTIYRLENGDRILRFTNFSTSNGPNVHVYRVDADDAKDSATVKSAASIDLGTIRETSVTRTTLWALICICRSTAPFRSGAKGLPSISVQHH
jgi:hypothetical protein